MGETETAEGCEMGERGTAADRQVTYIHPSVQALIVNAFICHTTFICSL